jgi:hypothetical protein
MAGLKVVSVKVLADGNLDLVDLKTKAEQYKDNLAAFMVGLLDFSWSTRSDMHVDHVSVDVRCLRAWGPRCLQDYTR